MQWPVVGSATTYCHVLVDCEYMLWMIGGALKLLGESEEEVGADILWVTGGSGVDSLYRNIA